MWVMAQAALESGTYPEILQRVFDFSSTGMTVELAQSILRLDFPPADAARLEILNEKANEGILASNERAELEAYVNVANLLALWQSKARRALQYPSR